MVKSLTASVGRRSRTQVIVSARALRLSRIFAQQAWQAWNHGTESRKADARDSLRAAWAMFRVAHAGSSRPHTAESRAFMVEEAFDLGRMSCTCSAGTGKPCTCTCSHCAAARQADRDD